MVLTFYFFYILIKFHPIKIKIYINYIIFIYKLFKIILNNYIYIYYYFNEYDYFFFFFLIFILKKME